MGRHRRALGSACCSSCWGPGRCRPCTRPVVEPCSTSDSCCNPGAPCMGVGHSSDGGGHLDSFSLVVGSGPCGIQPARDNGPYCEQGRKVDLLYLVPCPASIPDSKAGPQVEI